MMATRRRTAALLVAIPIALSLSLSLSLSGCTAGNSDPDAASSSDGTASVSPTPSPTPTFATVADLAGSRWYGVDSEDEDEMVSFTAGGTVLVEADGRRYENAAVITGDSLAFDVHWDAPYGVYHYTVTVDPGTQKLVGGWTPEQATRKPGTLSFDYVGAAHE